VMAAAAAAAAANKVLIQHQSLITTWSN